MNLLSHFPSLQLSVTYTTRTPRNGEKNGIDYHFISKEEFQKRIDKGDFLEWVFMHGNFYGCSRSDIETGISEGKHLIMVIDTEGAKKVKELLHPVMIFIAPPSMETLKERIVGRNSESEESLQKRLTKAHQEMDCVGMFDYVVMNDDFSTALITLACIIVGEVHKHKQRLEQNREILYKSSLSSM